MINDGYEQVVKIIVSNNEAIASTRKAKSKPTAQRSFYFCAWSEIYGNLLIEYFEDIDEYVTSRNNVDILFDKIFLTINPYT